MTNESDKRMDRMKEEDPSDRSFRLIHESDKTIDKTKEGDRPDRSFRLILASGSPRRRDLLRQAGYDFEVEVSQKEEEREEQTPGLLARKLSEQKAMEVAARHLSEQKAMDAAVRHLSEQKAMDVDAHHFISCSNSTDGPMDREASEPDRKEWVREATKPDQKESAWEATKPDRKESAWEATKPNQKELAWEATKPDRKEADPEEASPSCIVVAGADTLVAMGDRILGKPADNEEAFAMLRSLSAGTHQVWTGVTLIKIEDGQITGKRSFAETTHVTMRFLSDREILDYIATDEPQDKAGAYGIQGRAAVFVSGIQGDYFNVVGLPLCRFSEELSQLVKMGGPVHLND